ncbi:MAG: hypothetical protein ACREBU_01455 [Nitrososphaera sp.]
MMREEALAKAKEAVWRKAELALVKAAVTLQLATVAWKSAGAEAEQRLETAWRLTWTEGLGFKTWSLK